MRPLREVEIGVCDRPSINIEVLVVDGNLLEYDLLIGVDIIKKMGDVPITSCYAVSFPQFDSPLCAAITINGRNLLAKYDEQKDLV